MCFIMKIMREAKKFYISYFWYEVFFCCLKKY